MLNSTLVRLGAILLLGSALIAGCGNSSSGSAQVRVVNATVSVPSIDVFSDDVAVVKNVAVNTASAYASASEGSHTIKVAASGTLTALNSSSASIAKDNIYTLVAWGRAAAVQTFYLTDAETAPATGNAKVRLLNTAVDAGALDLYLTTDSASLADATPVASGIAVGRIGVYNELGAGTYRLRVTGAGSKTDLRLDLPNYTLAAQDIATLILQPSQSGVLVHGLSVLQKSTVTAYANTLARARLIASVAGNGTVTADLGGTSLAVGLPSPGIGSYVLVPSGSPALSVTVNGTAVAAAPTSLAAGADYTIMAYGAAAAPQLSVIYDENRLPTSSTGARMRLINGLHDQGTLTLAMDFSAVANNVAIGAASDFTAVNSNSSSRLDVTSGLTGDVVFTTGVTNVNIQGLSVYTVLVLDGAAKPSGVLRKER